MTSRLGTGKTITFFTVQNPRAVGKRAHSVLSAFEDCAESHYALSPHIVNWPKKINMIIATTLQFSNGRGYCAPKISFPHLSS